MYLFSLNYNPDVTVLIESTGIKSSPEGDRPTYHVQIEHTPTNTVYRTDGFGPVLGFSYFESERDEYEAIVESALLDLVWFANDPDEFVSELLNVKPMTLERFREICTVVESLENAAALAEIVRDTADENGNHPLTAIPLN